MKNKNRLNYNQFINIIDKEVFIKYYSSHNVFDTADYYNTIPQNIIKYCKEINYKKDKIKETLENINKDTLKAYYNLHTFQETLKYFNLTPYRLTKILKIYNIKKYNT